jgi:hypothetical protein
MPSRIPRGKPYGARRLPPRELACRATDADASEKGRRPAVRTTTTGLTGGVVSIPPMLPAPFVEGTGVRQVIPLATQRLANLLGAPRRLLRRIAALFRLS